MFQPQSWCLWLTPKRSDLRTQVYASNLTLTVSHVLVLSKLQHWNYSWLLGRSWTQQLLYRYWSTKTKKDERISVKSQSNVKLNMRLMSKKSAVKIKAKTFDFLPPPPIPAWGPDKYPPSISLTAIESEVVKYTLL